MIYKNPTSSWKKWARKFAFTIFVGEGLLFVGAFSVWYKVNKERDYRFYLREKYPYLLELYYKTGEIIDSNNKIRQIDYAYWDSKHN